MRKFSNKFFLKNIFNIQGIIIFWNQIFKINELCGMHVLKTPVYYITTHK
jgi:hypothetical protein